MKSIVLILFCFFITSCSSKKSFVEEHKTHTMKLKKSLSVKFKSIDLISLTLSSSTSNASITVLGVDEENNKTVLLEDDVVESSEISIDSEKDLESYTLIVSTLQAKDPYGNNISDVAVYKVGEQEEINSAKKKVKSLRK